MNLLYNNSNDNNNNINDNNNIINNNNYTNNNNQKMRTRCHIQGTEKYRYGFLELLRVEDDRTEQYLAII